MGIGCYACTKEGLFYRESAVGDVHASSSIMNYLG